ncbi:MAG TPA: hypothetical protein VGL44_09395 [Gaiellales bacterium]|jgi:hypothetical protein
MPNVRMHVTGTAVGASDEQDAFAEMVRTIVGKAAENPRVQVRVGADDAVSIEITLERRFQIGVGEALDQLLSHAEITSEVIDEQPSADAAPESG